MGRSLFSLIHFVCSAACAALYAFAAPALIGASHAIGTMFRPPDPRESIPITLFQRTLTSEEVDHARATTYASRIRQRAPERHRLVALSQVCASAAC